MRRSSGAKNPFLSLWLTGANKVAGGARGHFLIEARRQQAKMTRAAQQAIASFWGDALAVKKRKRKRK